MKKQAKFITSHRSRVKRAEEYRKNSPEKISIFDREALVEFYLLEDIERLYKDRLRRNVTSQAPETRDGQLSQMAAQRLLSASLHLLKRAIEVSKSKILLGRYSEVWKAIPEGPLMRAASSTKYMDEMKAMLTDLLGQLSPEALEAAQVIIRREEELDEIQAHEKNVQLVQGFSLDEFDSIVRPSELAIPGDEKVSKKRTNPNLN